MMKKKDGDKKPKDGDKGKKTLSGKKPYKIGGDNPLGVRKIGESKPTGKSMMFVKPSPTMGKDATGSANFDRTPRTRATVSVGPATMSMGGKTAKSKGGMDMSKGTVQPKKSDNPSAKTAANVPLSTTNYGSSSPQGYVANVLKTKQVAKRSRNIAIGAGASIVGAGVTLSGGGKKIKQAAKYIANTKERKEAKRIQKAENDAVIVERNKGKATFKASKSTMKKLKAK